MSAHTTFFRDIVPSPPSFDTTSLLLIIHHRYFLEIDEVVVDSLSFFSGGTSGSNTGTVPIPSICDFIDKSKHRIIASSSTTFSSTGLLLLAVVELEFPSSSPT